jgi:hypothetical protein
VCVYTNGDVRESTWRVRNTPITCRTGEFVWSW